jgi:hypothetical protein
MIHYHGLPITPEHAAVQILSAGGPGHAFVSFAHPDQLGLAARCCQSFAIDNGAFSAWKAGRPITDWTAFYQWAGDCRLIPSCDFAVIPDVIDGSEADNDALLAQWPLPKHFGAPVWHMHESFERLARLVLEWPRVCIGSSGQFSSVGGPEWWARMNIAMLVSCDLQGRPLTKFHGLRMLNPKVFGRLPFASADSTNIARNIGIDQHWRGGRYLPASKSARGVLMRDRIESVNAPSIWSPT